MKTKFYHFSQNNSGGRFVFDEKRGITNNVIIEAVDSDHANSRAEKIGLYFDGVEEGRDCSCCGDRWYRVSEYDERDHIAVHRLDGTVEWFKGF